MLPVILKNGIFVLQYLHMRHLIPLPALFAALIAVLGLIPKIDLASGVPITAQSLGIMLCGTVLGTVAMGLHHKLCHTLGGSFNLPHAEVHTVVLPQALAFNAAAAPQAMQRIEEALGITGRTSAAAGLFDLARDNGALVALKDIGATGFWAMMVFLGILVVGFAYEWKKGALDWE